MQEKHEQLGEFGAIPGAPNGPPKNVPQASSLPVSVSETLAGKDACGTSAENAQECSLTAHPNPAPENPTPTPAVLCDSAPPLETKNSEQKCAFSYTCTGNDVPQASSLPVSVPETLAGKDACGTLPVHDLAKLFPPMSDAEFADLKSRHREKRSARAALDFRRQSHRRPQPPPRLRRTQHHANNARMEMRWWQWCRRPCRRRKASAPGLRRLAESAPPPSQRNAARDGRRPPQTELRKSRERKIVVR